MSEIGTAINCFSTGFSQGAFASVRPDHYWHSVEKKQRGSHARNRKQTIAIDSSDSARLCVGFVISHFLEAVLTASTVLANLF